MQQSKKSRDTNGSSQKSLEQILHRRLRILEEHNKFVIKQQPVSCKESEERLSHLINETKYRLELLEASVCHLGYLVNEDDDALRELQEGVTFFSGGCAKKMCWMQDIEDRLYIFQGAEKGNLHLLETTKSWHMLRYAFVYFWKDIEKRLQLFLETNDTIWLLFDSKFLRRIRVRNVSKCTIWPVNDYLELLLIHVRNCLRLPQDRDGWLPKQPLDEETKLRLRHKFQVKLDVWKVRADKLRRLLGKLEDLRKYWPQQYQTSALLKTNPHIRRSKSASYLDQMTICDLAVEAAFPTSGIFRLPDQRQSNNFRVMTALAAGDFSILSDINSFLAGSSGEGVAMEEGWGHPEADKDWMQLYHNPRLLVQVPQVHQPPEDALLLYRSEGCPPAYCKIEVTNSEELERVLNWPPHSCTHSSNGRLWLHTSNLQAGAALKNDFIVKGPALQMGEDIESIATLVCRYPHPGIKQLFIQNLQNAPCPKSAAEKANHDAPCPQSAAEKASHDAQCAQCAAKLANHGILCPQFTGEMANRNISCAQSAAEMVSHDALCPKSVARMVSNGWPSLQQIKYIITLPMMLVMVGHKFSVEHYCQARLSWSFCELYLIWRLPEHIKQGYIACKYVLKRFLRAFHVQDEDGDGRNRVGSFHLKTVFLRYLQNFPPSQIKSPFCLMLHLLLELDDCLRAGSLPHVFLPKCDLLERVEKEERLVARLAIRAIMTDPLSAILTSPTDSLKIYGDVTPEILTDTFCRMSSNPTGEQNQQDLFDLLVRLDACRQKRYHWQKSADNCSSFLIVTGRPAAAQLAQRLHEI